MKTLCIFSHPDDELIFGWPIFQQKQIEKHLLCVTGGEKRLNALSEIAKKLGFTWETLNIEDMQIEKHKEELDKYLTIAVKKFKPDIIFTHNPFGEYNHPDHKAIFETVFNNKLVKNIIITDLVFSIKSSKWEQILSIPNEFIKYYNYCLCRCFDKKICSELSYIYKENGCWTWKEKYGDANSCKLFLLKEHNLYRKHILDVLTSVLLTENLIGAEIGVFKGETTLHLAECPQIKKIYAIDPWIFNSQYSDNKQLNREFKKDNLLGPSVNANNWEELFKIISSKLSINPKIQIIKKHSNEAFIPEILDFVFIDGDHEYNVVKQDLEIWSSKIKNGGIISGHDYTWEKDKGTKRGVCLAVNEFFKKNLSQYEPTIDIKRNNLVNRSSDRVWWQKKYE